MPITLDTPIKVSEQTAHILFHIEKELLNSSPAHTPGTEARAQRVRALLEPFKTDGKDFDRVPFLTDLRKTDDLIMKAALDQIRDDDTSQALHRALREWVENEIIE